MSAQRQYWAWGAFFVFSVAMLLVLGHVIAPFLAGMIIAYFLDPLADRLQRLGFSRLTATALITVSLILIAIVALSVVGPSIVGQIASLISNVPDWFEQIRRHVMELLRSTGLLSRLEASAPDVGSTLASVGDAAATSGVQIVKTVLSGGVTVMAVVANTAIALVIAFYMLLDWDRMIAALDAWLPRDHAPTIRRLAREIDAALAGFVRGQLLVCLILGTYYAIGLTLVGLNYGLLIGMFAGLISFIPFVGSALGLVLAVGVALAQFWGDWLMVAAVAGVFLFGQLVEGKYLSPKLVGGRVGLHPVLLIFALSAFGSLFGFAGMLLAVPVAAAIGVLAHYALERYFESPLYKGAAPDAQAEADSAAMVAAVTRDPAKAEAAAATALTVICEAPRDPAASPSPAEILRDKERERAEEEARETAGPT